MNRIEKQIKRDEALQRIEKNLDEVIEKIDKMLKTMEELTKKATKKK